MNPDGTGVVKLTDSLSFNGDAGWSPDGSQIAFDSDRRNHQGRFEIHVMDADGSNVRRVTTLPADAMFDLAPRFSPTGGGSCSPATSPTPDDRRCSRCA
jgi:Tol biopolymer transport system component